MEKIILFTMMILFISTAALAGDKTIIRKNNIFGQPDRSQRGPIVEEQYDGRGLNQGG